MQVVPRVFHHTRSVRNYCTARPVWPHIYHTQGHRTRSGRAAAPVQRALFDHGYHAMHHVSRGYCMEVTAEVQPGKPFKPAAQSFKLMKITGDGSCMFRAIVQGAQMAARGVPITPESAENKAANNLRQAVVQELRTRRSEIEPFVAGITDDWEGYLKRMSQSAAWGGEPEMVMAVNVVKRPITVYHVTLAGLEPIVTYGEELPGPAIHLLWRGAHYDLLVPEGQQQKQQQQQQ